MDGEEPNLLVVVLDLDPLSWHALHEAGRSSQAKKGATAGSDIITLPRLVDVLLVFLDAFLLTHRANQICVLAALPTSRFVWNDFLYPCSSLVATSTDPPTTPAYDHVSHVLVANLRSVFKRVSGDGTGNGDGATPYCGPLIVQALSKGLCYIQRQRRAAASQAARLLIIQASPDTHSEYNGMMNCIFSAQRSSIPVDCCILGHKESSFLQQAAHITGGIYAKPEHHESLLQYFLHLYLPNTKTRQSLIPPRRNLCGWQLLRLPRQEVVDFRAACFCHKRAVERAYVCSVCLSIFCSFQSECATCGTPARKAAVAAHAAALAACSDSLGGGFGDVNGGTRTNGPAVP